VENSFKILIIEKELISHDDLAKNCGYAVILSADSMSHAVDLIKSEKPQLIVIDSQWTSDKAIEMLRVLINLSYVVSDRLLYGDTSRNEFVDEIKATADLLCRESNNFTVLDSSTEYDGLKGDHEGSIRAVEGSRTIDQLIQRAVEYNIRHNIGLRNAMENFNHLYNTFVSTKNK
jgi:DNA-binding NarL/FixJ family response regulator